jgi:hypothetical protein
MAAGVAAAVVAPAPDSMGATPRRCLKDLDFIAGREVLKELAIVGEGDAVGVLNVAKAAAERHLAELVVVTVAFAVGGNMNQLGAVAVWYKTGHQAIRKGVSVKEQTLKCYRMTDRSIVKE